MTNLEIIDTALEIAQFASNSNFRALARKYYNIFLKSEAENFDYPFFRKKVITPLIGSQREYNLPADYLKSDNIYRYYNGKKGSKIPIYSNWKFDQLSVGSLNGEATSATIDQNERKVVFNAAPQSPDGKSFLLNYFRAPVLIDVSGADDANNPDFVFNDLLIEGVTMWLMKYQDDERFNTQVQLVDKMRRDNKLNVFDYDDNSTVELGNQFVAGSRPRRGGGNFGWGA